MLVLACRPGDGIVIDRTSRVVVLLINPDGTVKLGVEAPRHIPIDRDKVHQDVERHGRRRTLPT